MNAPRDFTPTHVIKYKQDGQVTHEWQIQLLDRHVGTAITRTGDKCWSLSPQGLWEYSGPLEIKRFPHGEVQVIKCGKAPRKIKKGQEPKYMPAGTVLTMSFNGEKWEGTCKANGSLSVADSAGLMGLGSKLCRKWLREHGHFVIKGNVD